ncbi:c-type cytochrome [Leptospira sp. 201903070]|uniref:C-type cytochrome n=1 Tax=Leptospira ainlahdjerensis TaxID=2810033 RepID=A0ABS2U5H7_9LEPT|nr:c-type cytochrome [Leptospira ainlahdjerensis]MBM9575626.1 c-type cytochrome [Leptospira ainlahdjerensis]
MLLKILKWTGAVFLSILLVCVIATALRQNLKYEAPYPDIKASKDPAVIKRGERLAYGAAHCVDCHKTLDVDSSKTDGRPNLSGGVKFELPVGNFYSPNITPDIETGIGSFSDAEIARSLRYGVRPDQTVLFDFMPFHNTSDEDLSAIISFLRSLRPVQNRVPKHELNPIGKFLKAFVVKPVGPKGEVLKSIKAEESIVYGEYLANSVANCSGCHTKRNLIGEYIGEPFAGGAPMKDPDPSKETLTPPNLTPHAEGRITKWTEKEFLARFRQGRSIAHSHMPWEAYASMSDGELRAIFKFLKSIKPAKNEP